MSTQRHDVSLAPQEGVHEAVRTTFGRVTVILGINGAGKSSVIRALVQVPMVFGSGRPVIYVEGGRVLSVPDSVAIGDQKTFSQHGNLAVSTQSHRNKRGSRLADRVRDAIFLLARRGEHVKIEHSEAVTAWIGSGRVGDCPSAATYPLELLFSAFNDIFPDLRLETAGPQKTSIVCRRGDGNPYKPSQLSDGERQVLAILADIALLAEPNSVVLVDEPELNLHPHLANRLWDRIEADLPNATFVYATHGISFAMRPGVSKVIALSRGREIVEVSDLADLDRAELREFLGAIPAIVTAAVTLVTEGANDDSFDSTFYRWVVHGRNIGVHCLGGSGDVRAAAQRTGVWSRLAAGATIVGIVDRDFKSDAELGDFAAPCLVMDLHEAESYLCFSRLVQDLGARLALVADVPGEEQLREAIRAHLRAGLVRIAAQRTFERARIRLAVSIERRLVRGLHDPDEARALIRAEAKQEAEKANSAIGETAAAAIFDEELHRGNRVLESEDEIDLLRYVPGKALLNELAPRIGCRDGHTLARAAARHLSLEHYPHLVALRKLITDALPAS